MFIFQKWSLNGRTHNQWLDDILALANPGPPGKCPLKQRQRESGASGSAATDEGLPCDLVTYYK